MFIILPPVILFCTLSRPTSLLPSPPALSQLPFPRTVSNLLTFHLTPFPSFHIPLVSTIITSHTYQSLQTPFRSFTLPSIIHTTSCPLIAHQAPSQRLSSFNTHHKLLSTYFFFHYYNSITVLHSRPMLSHHLHSLQSNSFSLTTLLLYIIVSSHTVTVFHTCNPSFILSVSPSSPSRLDIFLLENRNINRSGADGGEEVWTNIQQTVSSWLHSTPPHLRDRTCVPALLTLTMSAVNSSRCLRVAMEQVSCFLYACLLSSLYYFACSLLLRYKENY